jgi:hypothetical protein
VSRSKLLGWAAPPCCCPLTFWPHIGSAQTPNVQSSAAAATRSFTGWMSMADSQRLATTSSLRKRPSFCGWQQQQQEERAVCVGCDIHSNECSVK